VCSSDLYTRSQNQMKQAGSFAPQQLHTRSWNQMKQAVSFAPQQL
jgi:hypothetical protein